MGYSGKLDLKEKARSLREQGLSYKEILQHITVSKDTLSRWCRDIVLTQEQELHLLQNKIYGQKRGSLIAASRKREERIKRTKRINLEAEKEIGRLSVRENFVVGVALYAAEGTKMDGKGGFSNADPQIIKFMVTWLVDHAQISLTRLRGALWLHENLNEDEARKFWSEVTGLHLDQFYKTYIVKAKNGSKKKNIHPYGVFTIRFSDSIVHRRIMGWICALFKVKITSDSSRVR